MAEQLQVENERLAKELVQLRDWFMLEKEEMDYKDQEARQLREEVHKWALTAENVFQKPTIA